MSTKSARMSPGDTFTVRAGEFKGLTATIVDPQPFPDSDLTRRRKITVEVDGEQVYMLPRLLENQGTVVQFPPVLSPVAPVPAPVPAFPGEVAVPHPTEGYIIVPGDVTDPDDPRLDPWRPDPAIVKEYVHRTMPNGQRDTDFLLTFWERRENVLLVGDTQSGKTMLVQVLAVLAGAARPSGKPLPIFTLSGSSGVTDFDLFGQPTAFITPDGRERLVNLPGVADLATRAGGFLYLDELNFMSERTTSSLHPLLDGRRSFVNRQKAVRTEHNNTEVFMPEVVRGHDDLWVVSTINPGYKGTTMGEAITNRFVFIPWGYDDTVEKKLVPSAAVRMMGQALREARAQRAINTPVGTKALSRMCEHAERYGPETAVWMLTAMFLPIEQPKVNAIIQDRSVMLLLADEAQARQQES